MFTGTGLLHPARARKTYFSEFFAVGAGALFGIERLNGRIIYARDHGKKSKG